LLIYTFKNVTIEESRRFLAIRAVGGVRRPTTAHAKPARKIQDDGRSEWLW